MKKSRKRLLISSIAMLLVAMLALGTATFAWFTTSTTSHADGIKVKTNKVSHLVLSNHTKSNWTTHLDYGFVGENNTPKVMYPASSINGTNWFYGNAPLENRTDGRIAKDTELTAVSTQTYDSYSTFNRDYVFAEELNIKNEGAATINNLTLTLKGIDSDYLCVALVSVGDSADEVKTTDGTFTTSIYQKTGEKYKPVKANGKVPDPDSNSETSITTTTAATSKAINTGIALAPNEMAYYKLYVWFEGQDKDCKDANSGQQMTGFDIEVTGTPAE